MSGAGGAAGTVRKRNVLRQGLRAQLGHSSGLGSAPQGCAQAPERDQHRRRKGEQAQGACFQDDEPVWLERPLVSAPSLSPSVRLSIHLSMPGPRLAFLPLHSCFRWDKWLGQADG